MLRQFLRIRCARFLSALLIAALSLGPGLPTLRPALRPPAALWRPAGRPPAVRSLGPMASRFLPWVGARLPWAADVEKGLGNPAMRSLNAGAEESPVRHALEAEFGHASAVTHAAGAEEDGVPQRPANSRRRGIGYGLGLLGVLMVAGVPLWHVGQPVDPHPTLTAVIQNPATDLTPQAMTLRVTVPDRLNHGTLWAIPLIQCEAPVYEPVFGHRVFALPGPWGFPSMMGQEIWVVLEDDTHRIIVSGYRVDADGMVTMTVFPPGGPFLGADSSGRMTLNRAVAILDEDGLRRLFRDRGEQGGSRAVDKEHCLQIFLIDEHGHVTPVEALPGSQLSRPTAPFKVSLPWRWVRRVQRKGASS